MARLDALDREILAVLRADSRTSVSAMAERLGVVRGTVQTRINRLLSTRVIERFTVELGPGHTEERRVRAVCSLNVHNTSSRATLHRYLAGVEGVDETHITTGKWDLVLYLSAPDLDSLDRVLASIRALPLVATTETSILLAPLAP